MTPLRRLNRRERALIAVVTGFGLGVLVAVCGWILVSNQDRINEIQESRVRGSEIACEQQNERHERLFAQIETTAAVQKVREPVKYRETVAKARELEQLLDVVQPEEDCSERARKLVVETLGGAGAKRGKRVRAPGPLRLAPN